ncbi:MAG: DUF3794 domain-containing protein [Epulopiscium sp.]|nr:DUF3794 domain-containing protein [Candidatus Epulonipiscium sp.]
MSIELIKDRIMLDQRVGAESVQIILEDDVIVPDIKPDIAEILQVEGKIDLDPPELSSDRIGYNGKLQVQILYAAQGSDKPVHNMTAIFPIDDFIHMEGVQKNMIGEVQWDIEHLEYKLLNERKIHIQAVVEVTGNVMQMVENEVLVEVKGLRDVQVQTQPLAVSQLVYNQQENFVIKDELSVPAGKPNVQEILRFHASIINKDVKVVDHRIILKGDLRLCIIYTGYHDDLPVQFIEYELPFNGVLDCPGVTEEMYNEIDLMIVENFIQVKPDMDGEERVIELEVIVGAKVKVTGIQTIKVIEDAYCPGKKMAIKREPVQYQKILCKNKAQAVLKETLHLGAGAPKVKEIYYMTGQPKVEEVKVVEDKVIVEGVVHIQYFYATTQTSYPVYAQEETLPFRQVLETKGVTLDMPVTLKTTLDYISCNNIGSEEVEARIALSFDAFVVEQKEFQSIDAIELQDLDPNYIKLLPSMTIYCVQKGDSLWKIAKKYNTTVDELALLNDIEDIEKIYPGQKLLILKKMIDF